MRVAITNFTGGEIAPTLNARFDLARYANSLQCMENFVPNLHGGAERRPGTAFVAEVGGAAVLLPFSFSAEAHQNFVLVLGEKTLRVAAPVRGLVPGVSLSTPYSVAEAYEISCAQVGDVVYLAHRNHPLHKLLRKGSAPDYQWTLTTVALNTSLAAPNAPSCTFVRNNDKDDGALGYTLRYKVVAVDENGKESLASASGACNGKHPSDWVVGNYVSVSWGAVPGAREYNIYREEAGYFGFVGVHIVQKEYTPPSASQLTALQNLKSAAESRERERDQAAASYESLKNTYDAQCWTIYDDGNTEENTGQYCVHIKGQRDDALTRRDRLAAEAVSLRQQYNALYAQLYPQNTFIDNNYEADLADTPREDWDPFKDNNHPGVVAFHQQRMVLAATPQTPQAFYMSRAGDFENFRKSRPLKDDDPVEYLIASGSIDAITWAASFGDLLLGTSGSEYKASGSDGGPISATSISITAQSYWGSANLPPIIIGNSILHVQRHGARVRDLFYSLEKDGYAGNDLSIMAPHLFDGQVLRQWAYQQTPGSTIWVVRGDGVLLALTYMKEHDIWGWSRHVTEGKVLSVSTVSGDDGDVLMLVVERVMEGGKRYFLERLAPRWSGADGIEEAFYVDCGVTWRAEGGAADSTAGPAGAALAADSGGALLRDSLPQESVRGAAGEICGVTWRAEGGAADSTAGPAGAALAADSGGALLRDSLPQESVRGAAGETCGVTWRAEGGAGATGTSRVSGLSHLEGCRVAVLADGSPVEGLAGPCVVRGGAITLPFAARVVHVGLPFASTLSPLPVELQGQSGSTLGRKRAYGKCTVRMHASVGGKYGADREHLYDFPFVPARWGEACELFSGDVECIPGGGQDTRSTLWLVQDRPLPMQVVAVTAEMTLGQE